MAFLHCATSALNFRAFTPGLSCKRAMLTNVSNCSISGADLWPKTGVCSGNALHCSTINGSLPGTGVCLCAEGFTGHSDFLSRRDIDCHISLGIRRALLLVYFGMSFVAFVYITYSNFPKFLLEAKLLASRGAVAPNGRRKKTTSPYVNVNLGFVIAAVLAIVTCAIALSNETKLFLFDPLLTVLLYMCVVGFFIPASSTCITRSTPDARLPCLTATHAL